MHLATGNVKNSQNLKKIRQKNMSNEGFQLSYTVPIFLNFLEVFAIFHVSRKFWKKNQKKTMEVAKNEIQNLAKIRKKQETIRKD